MIARGTRFSRAGQLSRTTQHRKTTLHGAMLQHLGHLLLNLIQTQPVGRLSDDIENDFQFIFGNNFWH